MVGGRLGMADEKTQTMGCFLKVGDDEESLKQFGYGVAIPPPGRGLDALVAEKVMESRVDFAGTEWAKFTRPGDIFHKKHDPVNHPAHYTSGGIEVIDAIKAWGLDKDFCLANAVKYIARAGKKDASKLVEDLEKAACS
jgi:hypothetical protein